jgi:hypothetical protein
MEPSEAGMNRSAPLAVALAAVLAACGGYSMKCLRPSYPTHPLVDGRVRVVYLGNGGVLIAHGRDVLVTAPLYSNPTMGELAAQDFVSDRERIDAYLERYEDELSRASAVLVGHSHFDHLMDAPHTMARWTPNATLYGNDAMLKLLAPLPAAIQRLSVEGSAYDPRPDPPRPGQPVTVGTSRIRLWPIVSEHSLQFPIPLLLRLLPGPQPPVHMWRGAPEQPLSQLPTTAGGWSQGTVLAFVIDFMDDQDDVVFRVYYQDSPSRSPFGFPAPVVTGRSIDLALLCVGGSEAGEFQSHPEPILRQPVMAQAHVVGIHWEDFLNPRRLLLPKERRKAFSGVKGHDEETVHAVPTCDPEDWLERARRVVAAPDLVLPCPDSWFDLSPVATARAGQPSWELERQSENAIRRRPR